MRLSSLALALFAVLPAGLAARPAAPQPPAVKVGQAAPDFTLGYLAPAGDGKYAPKTVSLREFKGKKTVVLAFFPAAFSPG